MRTLGSILKASVVAGLLAGAIVSGFHAADRAGDRTPLPGRAAQPEPRGGARGTGGGPPTHAALGPGARVHRLRRHLGSVAGGPAVPHPRLAAGDLDLVRYGVVLAVLLGWSVAWLPFLKYPRTRQG